MWKTAILNHYNMSHNITVFAVFMIQLGEHKRLLPKNTTKANLILKSKKKKTITSHDHRHLS